MCTGMYKLLLRYFNNYINNNKHDYMCDARYAGEKEWERSEWRT